MRGRHLGGNQRPAVPEPAQINPPLITMPPIPSGNLWRPAVAARNWKHIVIHHTASEGGSVAVIHAEHLSRKDKNGNHWKGIGYHFLIGNGTGMSDGEIEPTLSGFLKNACKNSRFSFIANLYCAVALTAPDSFCNSVFTSLTASL